MDVLALSEKEITSLSYKRLNRKHIVISITSGVDNSIQLPNNTFRQGDLFLKFDDVQDIDNRFMFFTKDQAKQILQFVENYCDKIDLIVVQCQAGISRSVGVGSALSKIINFCDDKIYTSGIPNMFIYTTILDEFFINRNWKQLYPKMAYLRTQSYKEYLSPSYISLEARMYKHRNE